MNTNIQNALKCLERADYAGYFIEIEQSVPAHLRTNFNELRNRFVAGDKGWDFPDQLRVFATLATVQTDGTMAASPRVKTTLEKDMATTNRPLKVYISCQDGKDQDFKNELLKHLSKDVRDGKISAWDESLIPAGEVWKTRILKELHAADVIVLLLSSDYLADDEKQDLDLKIAQQKHENGTAKILPVVLRPCLWEDFWFEQIGAYPNKGKTPINTPTNNDAWLEVVRAIRALLPEATPKAAQIMVTKDRDEAVTPDKPVQTTPEPSTIVTNTTPTNPEMTQNPDTVWAFLMRLIGIFPKPVQWALGIVILGGFGFWAYTRYFSEKTPTTVTITGMLIGQPSNKPLKNVTVCLESNAFRCDETVGEDGIYIIDQVSVPPNKFISLSVKYPDGQILPVKDIDVSGLKPDTDGRINLPSKKVPDGTPTPTTKPSPSINKGKTLTLYGRLSASAAILNNIKEVSLTDTPIKKDDKLDDGNFEIADYEIPKDGLVKLTIYFKDGRSPIHKSANARAIATEKGRLSVGTIVLE